MDERERGQVLPLVALAMVVAGAVCLAAGRMGGAAVARAQAVTAADAAALAGAAEGGDAAARLASDNGGDVTRYERLGTDARVQVAIGGARATARARRDGGSEGARHQLAPALRAALARAGQLLGRSVPVAPPSPPGRSPGDADARHEQGLAVDVPPSFAATLAAVAAGAGLCRPYPDVHPVHFQLCRYRLR